MYFLFLDESYDNQFFALGGLIIHESIWYRLARELAGIKRNFSVPVNHEIKFRHLYSREHDRYLRRISNDRVRQLGDDLFRIMSSKRKKVKAIVTCIDRELYGKKHRGSDSERLYQRAISFVLERFQYVIFDQSDSSANGIVIVDERERAQNNLLRNYCMSILGTGTERTRLQSILRPILIVSSDYTAGLQLADLCVGSVRRMFSSNFRDSHYFEIIKENFIIKIGDDRPVGLKIFPYRPAHGNNLRALY